MRRRWASLAAIIGVTVAIAGTPANADASIGASPVANTTDRTGQRVWWGESSSELDGIVDLLESRIGQQADAFAGSALSSDRTRVEVYYVTSGADELRELRIAVGAHAFDQYIVPVQVQYSLTDLLSEQEVISARLDQQPGVASVGPSFTLNAIRVGIQQERLNELSANGQFIRPGRSSDETMVALGLNDVSSGVPIYVFPEERPEGDGTRRNDSAPYYGGAQISGPSTCSIGVPIKIGSARRILTAGHCGAGAFYNSGTSRYVGNTYTTTYPGNADIYGDWQLLAGSTYSLHLYSGSLTSSSYLSIVGGNWGARSEGKSVVLLG